MKTDDIHYDSDSTIHEEDVNLEVNDEKDKDKKEDDAKE